MREIDFSTSNEVKILQMTRLMPTKNTEEISDVCFTSQVTILVLGHVSFKKLQLYKQC